MKVKSKSGYIFNAICRVIIKILVVVGAISLIVIGFLLIDHIFDFPSIQNPNSNVTIKETNIQWLETTKLLLLILTPILTTLLFLNTMKIQKLNENNLAKDSLSKDFYNLLGLFKQEQEKLSDQIEVIYNKIKLDHQEELDLNEKKKKVKKLIKKIKCDHKKLTKANTDISKINEYKDSKEWYERLVEIDKKMKIIKLSNIKNYDRIATYLKLFHRIIKLLNYQKENEVINREELRMYLGIMRAQLSVIELHVILINSLEYERGTGLGVELIGNSFFGDDIDLTIEQHFICPEEYKDVLASVFVESEKGLKYRNEFRSYFLKTRDKKLNFLDIYSSYFKKI